MGTQSSRKLPGKRPQAVPAEQPGLSLQRAWLQDGGWQEALGQGPTPARDFTSQGCRRGRGPSPLWAFSVDLTTVL